MQALVALVAEVVVMALVSKISSVHSSVVVPDRRDPNAPQKGNDLQYTMTVDFMDAIFGKETEIDIPREEEM